MDRGPVLATVTIYEDDDGYHGLWLASHVTCGLSADADDVVGVLRNMADAITEAEERRAGLPD